MNKFHSQRLCLVGVGLIGGSLLRALRVAGSVEHIVGCGRDEAHLQKAVELGVIDEYQLDVADAVKGCDLVILAVPLGAMKAVMQQMIGSLGPETIITDVGSAKGSVVRDAEAVFGSLPVNFVPGHPIAGTEKSGVEASFAELYEQRRIILTPHDTTNADALNRVKAMWQTCGAEVVVTSVEHHDMVLAATSHLPHMLAYALVDTLARMDDSQEIFDYAAGGFRDFTRIASSDPQMWHDICVANNQALVAVLERFNEDLRILTEAVKNGDSDFLKSTFTRAKRVRDQFCEQRNNGK